MKSQSTDFEPWCHKRVYTLGYVLPTLRKFTAASVGSMSIDFVLADVGWVSGVGCGAGFDEGHRPTVPGLSSDFGSWVGSKSWFTCSPFGSASESRNSIKFKVNQIDLGCNENALKSNLFIHHRLGFRCFGINVQRRKSTAQ